MFALYVIRILVSMSQKPSSNLGKLPWGLAIAMTLKTSDKKSRDLCPIEMGVIPLFQ